MDELKEYEGFTVKLALVDSLPVIFFSLCVVLIATTLHGTGLTFWLGLIGASLMALSGLCKVLWKLLLGLKVGDVKILNKIFLPFMIFGFFLAVIAAAYGTVTKVINWGTVIHAMTSVPSIIFFILGICGLAVMVYVKSTNKRDEFNRDAKKNWIAQCVNAFAQFMIFLSILFAIH